MSRVYNKRRLSITHPDWSKQSLEERNYLKLHKCRDTGEAYAAAYLITKEHLIYQKTAYNLTWVNCEMGSFIMMNGRANPHKNVNGSLVQSLDVLDFSVIHLSWYERLQKRHRIRSARGVDPIQPIINAADYLRRQAQMKDLSKISYDANRTVAIMPFLGSENGAGHSKLGNRLQYLHSCFWSIYAEFPHVTAAVKNAKDAHFARLVLFTHSCTMLNANVFRNISGLPFYDVMLIENLPKSASLPVATGLAT
jgi:hypothetical protein